MQAVVLRGPGDLAVESVADPTPGAGELVLRVAAPLGFFAYFWLRDAYPELHGARWGLATRPPGP